MSFRIEIDNLRKYTSAKQVKKVLSDRDIKHRKLVYVPGQNHASFLVDTLEGQEKAIKLLEGAVLKGNKLEFRAGKNVVIDVAKPANEVEKMVDETPITEADMLRMTCPLYDLPYEDQLAQKQADALKLYENICASICQFAVDKLDNDSKIYGSFLPIVPSPVMYGYRNKCEFSCGYTPQGKRMAGFQAGPFKRGRNYVFGVDKSLIVTDTMKTIANRYSESILQKSHLSMYNLDSNSGFWKILTVRQFIFDIMIIVTVDPTELEGNELKGEIIEKVKTDLVAFFMQELMKEDDVRITSLYFATQTTNSGVPALQHLAGAPYVYERLLSLRFRVSPTSFFQPNASAAAKLYETIASVANLDKNTILLDICCGTGTIGISLAKKVKFVLGVEICKEAVEDANKNATDNDLQNRCKFICSPAENVAKHFEDFLPARAKEDKIVGILDPPRSGVHDSVIVAMRKMSQLKRLVYVSCDPKAAQKNMIDLCRMISNKFSGVPFKIDTVIPVDMLPHTRMTEWIVVMQRIF